MKKIIYIFSLIFFCNYFFAQNKTLEKTIYNIQVGILGTWINNETKLAEEISIRTEIGLNAGVFGSNVFGQQKIILAPVLNIEPRWYYNLSTRIKKNKNIDNNSSNFLTIATSYHPDWFVIQKNNSINITEQISIIPKWGIRRNVSNTNLNYEVGIGMGYGYYFLKQYGFTKNSGEIALDLNLRIGYTFKNSKK